MEVRRYDDPSSFLLDANDLLVADLARHQIMLGVAAMAVDQPDVYPEFHGFVVAAGGAPIAAASQTPPHNFILADPGSVEALDALAAAIFRAGLTPPGVLGNEPHVGMFATRWESLTGIPVRVSMRQGVFALEEVVDLEYPEGAIRPATWSDRDLMIEWWRSFVAEALPEDAVQAREADQQVDLRLDPGRDQGLDLWDVDGTVVAMSGHSSPVGDAVRIGPVYTPPQLRGRGYGTALVASQSRRLLDAGHRRCLLHTDLANPTSNSIYRRIGYRQVAEAAEYVFGQK